MPPHGVLARIQCSGPRRDRRLMARRPRLLVVDDKPNFLALFRRIAGGELDVLTASDVAEALALLGRERVDVIVSDVKMPGASGFDLLADVKNRYPDVEVILMTAFGAVPDAVTAIKAGAFHYLTKPFDPDEALALIRKALEKHADAPDRPDARKESMLIASSPAMQSVLDVIGRTAPLEIAVLITGEHGTGKDLVAREIHARSTRSSGRFAQIKCGALAEELIEAELFGSVNGAVTPESAARSGLFQEASRGTLFLDDVAELPRTLQEKVLRALDEGMIRRVGGTDDERVDVRIIAATSIDAESLVAAGRLREDLFYRLNVVTLRLPPLRERTEDIGPLADAFLVRSPRGDTLRLSGAARDQLEAFDWPGNVRQLENTIARAAALSPGEEISIDALPPEVQRAHVVTSPVDLAVLPYREILSQSRDRGSKEYFVALLKAVGGNVTQAAERAGIHRESLHRLLKRYGLRAEDYRPR